MLCSPRLILTEQPATKFHILIYFPYEALNVAPILLSRIPDLKTTNNARSTDSVHKVSANMLSQVLPQQHEQETNHSDEFVLRILIL